MHALSILAVPAILLAGHVSAGTAPARLVLFGASWCAPCRAELRQLPALAAAAQPAVLELAWLDRPAPARGVAQTVGAPAARLAETVLGIGHGLPAAAMIGADGRACAVRRGPVGAAEIAAMLNECGQAGSAPAA